MKVHINITTHDLGIFGQSQPTGTDRQQRRALEKWTRRRDTARQAYDDAKRSGGDVGSAWESYIHAHRNVGFAEKGLLQHIYEHP